jgi:hypothetical protein
MGRQKQRPTALRTGSGQSDGAAIDGRETAQRQGGRVKPLIWFAPERDRGVVAGTACVDDDKCVSARAELDRLGEQRFETDEFEGRRGRDCPAEVRHGIFALVKPAAGQFPLAAASLGKEHIAAIADDASDRDRPP